MKISPYESVIEIYMSKLNNNNPTFAQLKGDQFMHQYSYDKRVVTFRSYEYFVNNLDYSLSTDLIKKGGQYE